MRPRYFVAWAASAMVLTLLCASACRKPPQKWPQAVPVTSEPATAPRTFSASMAASPATTSAPASAPARGEIPWWRETGAGHDWRATLQERAAATTLPTDPAERDFAVKARMKKKIAELNFEDVEFKDLIQFLRDVSMVSIYVRWDVLGKAGVIPNTPITIKLKNTSLEETLPLVLAAARPSVSLAYGLDDGNLIISTESDLKEHPRREEAASRPAVPSRPERLLEDR